MASVLQESSGRWYCCDDASVSQVNAQTVLAEKAYMLFYVRSTLGPKIPKEVFLPPPPTSTDSQLSTTHSTSTVGNTNGTNGSISRVTTKPHLKFGSIAAFNGRLSSTHLDNGAEALANGKNGMKDHTSIIGSSESNVLSGSDRLSSVLTNGNSKELPIYGPEPRPSPKSTTAKAVRTAGSSVPVMSGMTDGASVVSAQTEVTGNDPVEDNAVSLARGNTLSSEATSSYLMVLQSSSCCSLSWICFDLFPIFL